MNTQVSRVALAALSLMVALIVATTYWQTWASAGLSARQDNAIQRVAQFSVKRGRIFAAGGRPVLAENVRRRVNGQTLYFRRYPARGLFAHLVGYSTQVRFRTGIEQALNDYLTGANANLNTVLDTTFDRPRGTTVRGNDLILTVNGRAQQDALQALGGRCGAAVELEPRTGKELVTANSHT